ncbi:MAG: UDP-N-acetylmuramoyl-tripeptide--D-alanyl-D-alanine ligase, partial [Holophagales bacterium]|nr:UDP-N-acetylmuramoyl-tripeptide--D-alanyl-D-alanine ligase [Holophagales bacterium]
MFSLSELSFILDAKLVGDGDIAPGGACLDSRTIRPGECFVALKAERDGHEYAGKAVEGGASCLLVDHLLDIEIPQLVAADTTAALQAWGQARLRLYRPSAVFGVTGSVGKTSTKELLAGAVSGWKTPGNRNNTLGLPAALAMLPGNLGAAVLEMGMSTPGEIKRLTEIAAPDFGVITNIGFAHLENFSDGQEGIARAKGELIEGLKPGGTWVFPKGDLWCQWISQQPWASNAKPVPVGEGADFSVNSIARLGLKGEGFKLQTPMGGFEFTIKLTGLHQVQNAALAASIALVAGFKGDEIISGLAAVEPEEGRGRLYPLSSGGWLLDESYNACQDSMVSCATALLGLDGGEPVAILGCMRELGPDSASIHEATGRALRRAGLSRLWVYGDFAANLA